MPFYRMGNTTVHIKLSGRKKPPAPCCAPVIRESVDPLRNETRKIRCRCMEISSILCDWENEDGKTCDAPLCPKHAHEIGLDKHLCALHFDAKRAAEPDLFE